MIYRLAMWFRFDSMMMSSLGLRRDVSNIARHSDTNKNKFPIMMFSNRPSTGSKIDVFWMKLSVSVHLHFCVVVVNWNCYQIKALITLDYLSSPVSAAIARLVQHQNPLKIRDDGEADKEEALELHHNLLKSRRINRINCFTLCDAISSARETSWGG